MANDDVRDIKARSGGADDSVGESNDAGTAAASLSPPPAPVTCAEDAASVFRGYRDSLQNKRLPLAVAFALAAPPKLKSQLWDSVQNMLCSSPRQNFIYPLLAVLPQFAPQDDAAALIDTTFQYLTSAPTLGKRQTMQMLNGALILFSSSPQVASCLVERLCSKLVSKGPLERLRGECLDLLEEIVRLCDGGAEEKESTYLRSALSKHHDLVTQRLTESGAWRGPAKMRKRMASIAAFIESIEDASTLSRDPLPVDNRPAAATDIIVPAANCADKGKGMLDTISLVVRSSDLCGTPVGGSSVPIVDSPISIVSPPSKKLCPRNAELVLPLDPQNSC